MVYALWIMACMYSSPYSRPTYLRDFATANLLWAYTYEMCTKTVFVEVFFLVWCTLIAQIVLSARLYALTMGNKRVTSLFVCITVPQLSFGLYQAALSTREPAKQLPPIDLSAYQLCVFARHWKAEIAYTAISLCYDFLGFLVIVFFAIKSGFISSKMPRLLRAIIQDATVYFLIIFTSHFVFEMTLLLLRPNLQLLSGSGNYVFLPVMIGRMMLSLKKAADPSKAAWSLTSLTHMSSRTQLHTIQFASAPEEFTA